MPDAGSGDTAAGDIDQHSVFDLTSPEDSSENDTTETQIATDIDSPEADLVPTDGSESPDTNSADADSEDTYDGPQIIGLEEAKALYSKYCSICHGENGDGYIADGANQLNNQSWLTTVTNDHIRQGIALGRPPTTMSSWAWPYGGPLSTIEIESLVQLIRGWQTEPTVVLSEEPIVGSAQRGAGIWEFQCASCHGSEGQGGTYSAVGHPVLLSTASDAFLRYAIAKGRPGTPMPGYENILTSQGIDDLVALLRSWAGGTIEPITEFPNDEAPAVLNPGAENADFGTEFYTPMDLIYTAYGTGQRMAIIDARPAGDYLTEHISGAISVPFYAVEQHLDRIPMDVPVIAYCACPHAESGEAAAALIAAGYTDVHVLDEGFFAWRDMGYPTSIGANP
jgi:mono/diheme cytochrome c family protein/rhodanese-related sulfurtransferase